MEHWVRSFVMVSAPVPHDITHRRGRETQMPGNLAFAYCPAALSEIFFPALACLRIVGSWEFQVPVCVA